MSERLVRWAKAMAAGHTVVSVEVVVDEPDVVMVMTVPKQTADLAARQVSDVLPLDLPSWLHVEGVDVTVRFSDEEQAIV
jgi:ketol-acid reductoisomerase